MVLREKKIKNAQFNGDQNRIQALFLSAIFCPFLKGFKKCKLFYGEFLVSPNEHVCKYFLLRNVKFHRNLYASFVHLIMQILKWTSESLVNIHFGHGSQSYGCIRTYPDIFAILTFDILHGYISLQFKPAYNTLLTS